MPIRIPDALPARAVLEDENIFAMTERRASTQDIRPLKIIFLNLMPAKIITETQVMRCLSNTPLQIEVEFLQISSHKSKNTPQEHLLKFYQTFDEVKENRYDGMIITGTPVELLPFEEVDYWEEMCRILDWARTNVFSLYTICWGAQAALYHYYGIPKYPLDKKIFGVFKHRVLSRKENLFRGFDDYFYAPHSRHTENRTEDLLKCPHLKLLACSKAAGAYVAASVDDRQFFVFGHGEYDADTLANEYFRDLSRGLHIELPANYFRDDDPERGPQVIWRSHGQLLYTNWLNYYVYQTTPYDLTELPPRRV